MSIEPVDSADEFLRGFIAYVLTYASVKQERDHGTPQAADRAAKLCDSFLTLFRNPTLRQHLLDYRGEHVQDLIDTMQSLLDNGFVEQKLTPIFIRALATLAIQSQLYPSRFLLQNVTDQGVKVTLPYSRTAEGYMEGKAVCIKRTSASHHLNPNLEERFRETMVWAQLSHENVLPFYGMCEIGDVPPRLISPFLENGKILDFVKRNPDCDRRSFVCDIAAGMSYLHGNGLIHTGIFSFEQNIFVTNAVPPRACLAYPSLHSFQEMVAEMDELDETSGFDQDVRYFSYVALDILARELIDYCPHYDDIFSQGQRPFGYLYNGLDESMWRLLRDCHEGEFDHRRPTACQIVERLQDGKEQWEMALAAQKHETDSIVKSAMTYVSLKQDPDKTTRARAATQASALYDSIQNMFRDLRRYECLIECRGEGAQALALIESIQSLLDDDFVEQKFRNTFILALAMLAWHSHLYPARFLLHGVTDQGVKVGRRSTKGSMGGKVGWFGEMLWAQLSHENVLPFYGICEIDGAPRLVSPFFENDKIMDFLARNPDANRRLFVCDVAAGMSYLHDNGLNLRYLNCGNIGITNTVPPRACLIRFHHACLEPAHFLPDWSNDAKKKFSGAYFCTIHDRDPAEVDELFTFSITAFMILTGQEYVASYTILRDGQRLHMPVGYLDRGLDESMWQFLLDCRTRDLDVRPTARQIVEWLSYPEAREKQTRLRIAKKREKVARLLSATCASVQRYKSLLSCNDNDAQTLLDTFQLLLDTSVVEDRTQLVSVIKRLSGPAKRFPRRFFLGPVPAITADPVTSGGFADVYKVDFQGEATCFKVIRFYAQSQVEHIAKAYAKEAIVWAQLSHPNVLPFYGLAHSPTRLSFVTRWATQGDLTQYLSQNPGANGILLCKDTAAGAEYLHMNDIIHGDLKGCNILIDSSGRASLCDFGLASVTDPKIIKWTSQSTMASKGGTARWQAPELHESEDEVEEVYNTKATDVFAWAGICYEIFTGCLPFFELSNPVVIVARIIQGHTPTRPETDNIAWGIRGLNERVWDLMKECWHFKPSTRPDMTQILSKLNAESVIDTRPPGEWEKDASMRFRNSQDSKGSDSVNSMLFWEDLESLLSRVAPDVEDSFSRLHLTLGASATVATYLAYRLNSNSHSIALDSDTSAIRQAPTKPTIPPHTKNSTPSEPESEPVPEVNVVPEPVQESTGEPSDSAGVPATEGEATGEEAPDAAGSGGAFNPVTGEINWDCPCLGGMAHGPCGPQFREAFSCFVFSEDEPKGINCVEKFKAMQTCFREHPEIYADEIDDEDGEAASRPEVPEGDVPTPGPPNDDVPVSQSSTASGSEPRKEQPFVADA
ncbi:hypothetical protein DXG01_003847 [Tephrocybe rancida]|nr:hypothetical protein DXG01_003847 [Tephrocybe rancida]